MDQKTILGILKELKSGSKKRNYNQSYDLIINLKNVDVKKQDQQLDFFVALHHSLGKKRKVAAFVGPEMKETADAAVDKVILLDDFTKFSDKKAMKKLAKQFDFFLAQATIMPKVAAHFGKVFGPRGKMPNPKLGCVVVPQTNLKQLCEKLQHSVWAKAKTHPLIQVKVGAEDMKDEDVVDNIITFYNGVIHHLPSEKNNIKSVYLKLTMGSPFRLDATTKQKQKDSETGK